VTATEIEASGGGVRVNPADPLALLDAAEHIGSDKDSADNLGRKGLRFRQETLSEDVAIGHYHDFVSILASSRGR
jgi:colanic acid biosynthesis glycosyl transferase WcaI